MERVRKRGGRWRERRMRKRRRKKERKVKKKRWDKEEKKKTKKKKKKKKKKAGKRKKDKNRFAAGSLNKRCEGERTRSRLHPILVNTTTTYLGDSHSFISLDCQSLISSFFVCNHGFF